MTIPIKEKIGILIKWDEVIAQAVKDADYERFENAARKAPVTVKKAIFIGLNISHLGFTRDKRFLEMAFELYKHEGLKNLSFQIASYAHEIFTTTNLPKDCLDLLVSKLTEEDLAKSYCSILKNDNIDFLAEFVRKHDVSQATLNHAFILAAGAGEEEKMAILYEKGAEVNAAVQPSGERTALLNAACNKFSEKGLACVKRLLSWGADPNFTSAKGNTALSLAVVQNNKPVIAELLNAGAVDESGIAEVEAKELHPDDLELKQILLDAQNGILPELATNGGTDLWRKLHEQKLLRDDDSTKITLGFI